MKQYTIPGRQETGFRSELENRAARIFQCLGLKVEYEPNEFTFKSAKGIRYKYTPDFFAPATGQYFEIKPSIEFADTEKIEAFCLTQKVDLILMTKERFFVFEYCDGLNKPFIWDIFDSPQIIKCKCKNVSFCTAMGGGCRHCKKGSRTDCLEHDILSWRII